MSAATAVKLRKPLLSLRSALWLVLLLWAVYTFIYTYHNDNNAIAFLEFIPGLLGVAALLAAGLSLKDCFLHPARISWKGALWLGASLLILPVMWITGRWVGWHPVDALLYAPASGISQELFFRAALLPILLAVLPGRPTLATLLHALIFAAWHLPKAFMTAPLPGAVGVAVVTFICGLVWAKQVQQDRTVYWLMAFHSIILIVNTFFTWS